MRIFRPDLFTCTSCIRCPSPPLAPLYCIPCCTACCTSCHPASAVPQALYFIPAFRELVLAHKPEPDIEFCLTCELHFLFRMLATGQGTPCQVKGEGGGRRGMLVTAAPWWRWGGGLCGLQRQPLGRSPRAPTSPLPVPLLPTSALLLPPHTRPPTCSPPYGTCVRPLPSAS